MVKKLVYKEYGNVGCVNIPPREGFKGVSRFAKINPSCPDWARLSVLERESEERSVKI